MTENLKLRKSGAYQCQCGSKQFTIGVNKLDELVAICDNCDELHTLVEEYRSKGETDSK